MFTRWLGAVIDNEYLLMESKKSMKTHIWRRLRISFYVLLILIVCFVVSLFTTRLGYHLRYTMAEMLLSSQHGYLAKYTLLNKTTLDKISTEIFHPKYVNTDPKVVTVMTTKVTQTVKKVKTDTITVDSIDYHASPTDYYKGYVMFISNPKDIHLAVSQAKNFGQQINVIAKENDAIGAINAGGFKDANGVGNGGTPVGIVVHNGSIVNSAIGGSSVSDYTAGFTKNGVLITGKYSANQLLNMGVVDAAGFRPQLISNGKPIPMQGDGGWGPGPKTAIGQRKDGTVIFVVIDGRQPGYSLGATIVQLQQIMEKYGAVNATCMDGGSSSNMYFDGKVINIASSVDHIPRYLPNAWIVQPQSGIHTKLIEDGKTVETIQ